MSGLLLEATVFMKRLTAPTDAGYKELGNSFKLELSAESETKVRISKKIGTYGQALDTVVIPKPHKLTIGTDELGDQKSLARALLGTDTTVSVAGAAVTDEAVTAKHDVWLRLAHNHLATSPAPVVTNDAETVTYVAGTHYEIDSALGMFKALSTGTITDSQALKVNYTYLSQTGFKVTGATDAVQKFEILAKGRNLADGKLYEFHAHRVPFAPSGAFDLLGDDFAQIESAGEMEIPEGQSEPYTLTAITTS